MLNEQRPYKIAIICLITISSVLGVLLCICKTAKDDMVDTDTQIIHFSLINEFSLTKVTPDEKQFIELTNSEYWCVEYGLSAWPHGLTKMFKLESTGTLTLFYNQPLTSFKECTLYLKPESINTLYKEIVARSLMHLDAFYLTDEIVDGRTAVLIIRQGTQVKRITCYEYFPKELLFFLSLIDHTIQSLGSTKQSWHHSELAEITSDNLYGK